MCDDFEAFDSQNKADWAAAIHQAFGSAPPRSAQWTDLDAILHVLTPFMGQNLNYTILPSRGGLSMRSIARSPELECLEFCPGNDTAYPFHPTTLFFEYFPESPWNSFFLVETKSLQPCGVYEKSNSRYVEEVVEVSPGEYIDRSHRETGILGYEENGREIPLPETCRLVVRHMQGKFLIVAKRSIWNCAISRYGRRHSQMTAQQIREQIQRVLDSDSHLSQQEDSGD